PRGSSSHSRAARRCGSARSSAWPASATTRTRRARSRPRGLADALVSERAARLVERGLAQLRTGGAVAELLAHRIAVARTDDIAHVRFVLERVAVLLRMALRRAQVLRWIATHGQRLF